MTSSRTNAVTEQVSQAQIDALGERMDKGFDKIAEMLKGYEERLRGLENREAGCQPLLTSQMAAAWRKLDSHDAELEKIREAVSKMAKTAGQLEAISKWLLGILTTVIAAVIIAFLTGKIDIIVR